MSTLATLRGHLARIEAHGGPFAPDRVALGHAEADATLAGGLARGAVHEVFAEAGRHSAVVAACGHAVAVDGGDAMDRARGAFAAGGEVACVGRTALRRRACPQPSWPARAMDHGMGMR